jgi:hypothetical protein
MGEKQRIQIPVLKEKNSVDLKLATMMRKNSAERYRTTSAAKTSNKITCP